MDKAASEGGSGRVPPPSSRAKASAKATPTKEGTADVTPAEPAAAGGAVAASNDDTVLVDTESGSDSESGDSGPGIVPPRPGGARRDDNKKDDAEKISKLEQEQVREREKDKEKAKAKEKDKEKEKEQGKDKEKEKEQRRGAAAADRDREHGRERERERKRGREDERSARDADAKPAKRASTKGTRNETSKEKDKEIERKQAEAKRHRRSDSSGSGRQTRRRQPEKDRRGRTDRSSSRRPKEREKERQREKEKEKEREREREKAREKERDREREREREREKEKEKDKAKERDSKQKDRDKDRASEKDRGDRRDDRERQRRKEKDEVEAKNKNGGTKKGARDHKDKDAKEAKEEKGATEAKDGKDATAPKEDKGAADGKDAKGGKDAENPNDSKSTSSSRFPSEEPKAESGGIPGLEAAAKKAARLAAQPWLSAQAAWNAASSAQPAPPEQEAVANEAAKGAMAKEVAKGAAAAARKQKVAVARRSAPPPPWMAAAALFKGPGDGPKGFSPEIPDTADGTSKKLKLDLKDIGDLQRTLSEERNKLRLFVIKAKEDFEDRTPGQRGATGENEYYNAKDGEEFGPDKRFRIEATIGRGVFSSVYHCKDTKEGEASYAVKIIRANAMMRKAAEKEVEMYKRLAKECHKEDPEGARHLINLASVGTFEHSGHLCFIFELLKCDMRFAMQKYGQDGGLALPSVAQYARQLLLGLRALRVVGVIHGDLKPDNVLLTLNKAEVQICDFGAAMDASENVKTPYVQPRYYRAPEVILGAKYDGQIDVWSVGATIFEIATGRILFTGKTNNQILKQMIEVCGVFPRKIIAEGEFSKKHFQNYNFLNRDPDSLTGQVDIVEASSMGKPARPISSLLQAQLTTPAAGVEVAMHDKWVAQLIELVSKCLTLDPSERIEPALAVDLPFFRKES